MTISLIPRTLRTRLLIFIVLSLLLTQAATFFAVSHYRQNFLDKVTPELIATTVQTLRIMLVNTPESERADLVAKASNNSWKLSKQTLPDSWQHQEQRHKHKHSSSLYSLTRALFAPPPAGGWRQTITSLNDKLGEGTQIAITRGQQSFLFISLTSDNKMHPHNAAQEWLIIPLERVRPPLATTVILLWLGGFVIVLLIAGVFAWNIAKPLTRLTYAVGELANGKHIHVKPSGPTETKTLAHQFNHMIDAITEAESVRRTLLAGLPHDLKGPLSRMRMRTELCDDEVLKAGLRQDLLDMQSIIEQFINYVRGTDPGSYQFIDIDLDLWLHERVQTWQSTDLSISLESRVKQVNIHADPTALARLFDNIINNALQHGAPPIEVRLSEQAHYLCLEISDHGSGIELDKRDQARQPFARLDPARTRTGNVGLGLALVDVITQAHQGQLSLLSAQSGGLCVQILLPRTS